jgi:hypothetical protein
MDGDVFPSFLGVSSRNVPQEGFTAGLTDYVFRTGTIRTIIPPSDERSYGKRSVEYDVDVVYGDGAEGRVNSTYRGVMTSNGFGSSADYIDATMRVGNKVLLLCVGGNQNNAVILGGFRDQSVKPPPYQDLGHHLTFEFNGINFNINQDGEATLFFRGATKPNGDLKVQTNDFAGATFKISKDGSVSLYTVDQSTGDDESIIKIDHTSENLGIDLQSKGGIRQSSETVINIDAKQEVKVNSDFFEVNLTQEAIFQTSGLRVNSSTDAFLLGTRYRAAEKAKNLQLQTFFGTLSGGAQTAFAGFTTAAALNAIPVVGGILALPGFTAGIIGLQTIATSATGIANAISVFESNGDQYLSKKHTIGD